LVEKAKTTPDQYPLTLNALTNGCNQKSNRDPQMSLETHEVEDTLEELRGLGAVLEVVGGGRVSKYRHMMYEWMGVEKAEAAVMTELLLRGAQTLGELRGRAARMEPIADVSSLRPIVQSLIDKGLVISLTPAGRGQIVTHALYLPEELEKVKKAVGSSAVHTPAVTSSPAPVSAPPTAAPSAPAPAAIASNQSSGSSDSVQQLRHELDELKSEVARLKSEVNDLWSNLR
jgi:uncharacterized protein YceH (UPF0502 family)